MDIRVILREAFDNPHKFSDVDRHTDEDDIVRSNYSSSFKASDGSEVTVYFDPEKMEPGVWDIHFERQTSKGGYSENITDQGDAFKIYATVLKIIAQFIEKKNPKTIKFSARKLENSYYRDRDTQSRAKLYERMINKFAKQMGYKLRRKIENNALSLFILDRM